MIMNLVVIIAIVLFFIGLSYLTKRYNRMSSYKVADIIERFIEGKGSELDWDDFISSPISDPKLDKIRIRCSQLSEEFPPTQPNKYTSEDGIKVLKQYVIDLRLK